MKAKFLHLVFFVLLLASGRAVDLVTPTVTYYDIKVTRVEAEAVRISHREGAATVDFDDLPPAMQQEYGWTPEKSAARKAAREAEAKRIAEEERMAEEEANPKKKKKAAEAKAEMQPERVVDEEKLKAETEEALRESKAEAARIRAEIERERKGGAAATKAPAEGEPIAEPLPVAGDKPGTTVNRPVSAVGTISSIIGEEKTVTGNRNLLIAAGVSAAIVLLLFVLSAGKGKPRAR
jgi:type IV secretory pathway VirB10-like protein